MKGGLGNLMKQAQEVQANMQKAQESIGQIEVHGESGAGMVKVTMTGRHEVRRVEIDPELLKEDKEMLYIQYNNTQRARSYGLYNQALSGGVYELEYPSDKWIENCDFNTTKYIEMSEKL